MKKGTGGAPEKSRIWFWPENPRVPRVILGMGGALGLTLTKFWRRSQAHSGNKTGRLQGLKRKNTARYKACKGKEGGEGVGRDVKKRKLATRKLS